MQEETTSPPPGEPSFVPPLRESPLHRPFDAAPLFHAVMEDDGPQGLADSLDQAYTTLAEYLVSDPGTAGHRYAHVLYDLRRVRDALLQGSGLRPKG